MRRDGNIMKVDLNATSYEYLDEFHQKRNDKNPLTIKGQSY